MGIEFNHQRTPLALTFSDSSSRFPYQYLQTDLPAELTLIRPFKIKLNTIISFLNHSWSNPSFLKSFASLLQPLSFSFVIRLVWVHRFL